MWKLLRCLVPALLTAYLATAADATNTPRPASELTFTLSDGKPQVLSHYRGRVVALEFILTYCSHCQAAAHIMTKLQQEYGPRDFQALDLAINGRDEGRDPNAATALVDKFVHDFDTGFAVGWVPREQMPPFLQFSVVSLISVPQLALIDRGGNIRFQTPPGGGDAQTMSEASLRTRIEALLAEPAPSAGRARPRQKATLR